MHARVRLVNFLANLNLFSGLNFSLSVDQSVVMQFLIFKVTHKKYYLLTLYRYIHTTIKNKSDSIQVLYTRVVYCAQVWWNCCLIFGTTEKKYVRNNNDAPALSPSIFECCKCTFWNLIWVFFFLFKILIYLWWIFCKKKKL